MKTMRTIVSHVSGDEISERIAKDPCGFCGLEIPKVSAPEGAHLKIIMGMKKEEGVIELHWRKMCVDCYEAFEDMMKKFQEDRIAARKEK